MATQKLTAVTTTTAPWKPAYYGNATPWYSGSGEGPWIMTDQENNLVGCVKQDASKGCTDLPSIPFRFVTAIAKGQPHRWASLGGDAQKGSLKVMFDGPRVNLTYDPMRKQGAILLGNGGDNSDGSQGTFYEGAITAAGTFPSDATDNLFRPTSWPRDMMWLRWSWRRTMQWKRPQVCKHSLRAPRGTLYSGSPISRRRR